MNNKWIIALSVAVIIGGMAILRLKHLGNPASPVPRAALESVPLRNAQMLPDQALVVSAAPIVEPRTDDLVAGLSGYQ